MPKLFISHATEDKDKFVRPLAEKLGTEYEVWYDEYSLNIGDSLREKIDEGLRTADYGVVVLSKSFFAKKWAQSELNGLFGLETKNRKIILPVWLDVKDEEVRGFSPMLADRKASLASDGVDRVVEDIRMAVSASSRTEEIHNPNSTAVALNRMWGVIDGWNLDSKILNSQRGAVLFRAAFEAVIDGVYGHLANSGPSGDKVFSKQYQGPPYAYISGPLGVCVALTANMYAVNTASYVTLEAVFYRVKTSIGPQTREDLETRNWAPTCLGKDEIGFKEKPGAAVLSAKDVAEAVVKRLCQFIEARVREQEEKTRMREIT